MRGIIRSDETIKTENAGVVVIIKTDPDSSSSFQVENFKDEKIVDLKIEDKEAFEAKISFWHIQDFDHVSKKMYVIKKNKVGEVSIFENDEDLLEKKLARKEKSKAS